MHSGFLICMNYHFRSIKYWKFHQKFQNAANFNLMSLNLVSNFWVINMIHNVELSYRKSARKFQKFISQELI